MVREARRGLRGRAARSRRRLSKRVDRFPSQILRSRQLQIQTREAAAHDSRCIILLWNDRLHIIMPIESPFQRP